MRDNDPAWDRERSELDHWLADLTNGDTTHPRFWTATIDNATELDSIAEDLKHLRHIEKICVVFRGWTEVTSASVRRLPRTDELMLLIDDELPTPPEEPPYHLLDGLPFTCVEVHNVPLTKSISRWLPTLPLLKSFGLGYCKLPVSEDAWADLPQCRRLSAVVTCFVDVSNSGMKSIGKIPGLKHLAVHHLDDRNRQVLSQLPATLELDSLSITGCSMFGDLSLSELSVDPIELNLEGTSVKFVAWGRKWLLSRKRLKRVTVPDFNISAGEAKQLNALGGPQITLTSPCW